MARGTRMSGFFLLLLTLISIFLTMTDASRPANGLSHDDAKGRKLIDIQGFDVSSLLGGLTSQSPDEGDADPSAPNSLEEEIANNAPSLLAGLAAFRQSQGEGDSDASPPSSLEEDVAKSAPTLLAGLAAFRQSQDEEDSAAQGDAANSPNLFDELNLHERLPNGDSPASAPTLAPSPEERLGGESSPSPGEGHTNALAPTPGDGHTNALAPTPWEGHAPVYAPIYGNGHIAVSPSSSNQGYDDVLAPSPAKGHDFVASSPSPSPGESY